MKVLIFGGSGKIGSAVAWDLAKDKDIKTIGIVGRHKDVLEKTKKWIGSDKVVPCILDINKKEEFKFIRFRFTLVSFHSHSRHSHQVLDIHRYS